MSTCRRRPRANGPGSSATPSGGRTTARRSAFMHSMNYRSVVVYGPAREVTDREEKWMAQKALVDHVCAGRSDQVRMPTEDELRQTTILAVSLEEASAKLRTGPPKDDEAD